MIPTHRASATSGISLFDPLRGRCTLASILLGIWSLSIAGCGLTGTASTSTVAAPDDAARPVQARPFLVIAHRGASGYRPEHTLAAYQLAIDQGADFIEPDLVPTKDGKLIARHENALAVVELTSAGQPKRDAQGAPVVVSQTTDVAERPEFSHLLTVREIDGRSVAGWFSEDFTLAQIKTLFARERIPALRANNLTHSKLRIATLDEIIVLLQQQGNRQVGMYPELKHPTHFRYGRRNTDTAPIGIDTAALLLQRLKEAQFTDPQRLYIQCFELETLRRLKHQLLPAQGMNAPLVQLFGKRDWTLPDVGYHQRVAKAKPSASAYLESVYGPLSAALAASPTYRTLGERLETLASDYASGIGPRKTDAKRLAPAALAQGLALHPYTVRSEAYFLSRARGALGRSVDAELDALYALGATGVFIDQPDLAVRWRSALQE